jgi:hypothetical protein
MLRISNLACGALISVSVLSAPLLSAAAPSATASDDRASIQALEGRFHDAFVAKVVRVTDVYRKLKGKWLIVQEHVSVPVDLATQKPDLQSRP